MTLPEAIATEPLWLQTWLNVLLVGMFVPALLLLIKANSRRLGLIILVTSFLAGAGVFALFGFVGYTRILGLPHILVWTPMAFYAWRSLQRIGLARWQKIAVAVYLVAILISLAFDYSDLFRYVALGETQSMI